MDRLTRLNESLREEVELMIMPRHLTSTCSPLILHFYNCAHQFMTLMLSDRLPRLDLNTRCLAVVVFNRFNTSTVDY